jgi:hypothetical protein
MRCAVCERNLHEAAVRIEDGTDSTDDDETAQHAHSWWDLCTRCYQAVQRELARTDVRAAARVRVALAVVAAEHGPGARPRFWDERYWDQLDDTQLSRLLLWLFAVAFGVHAAAFIAVAVYVAAVRH